MQEYNENAEKPHEIEQTADQAAPFFQQVEHARVEPPNTSARTLRAVVDATAGQQERRRLWGPLGMDGGVTVLGGKQKVGKSAFLWELALLLANGRDHIGRGVFECETGPRVVLFVAAELDAEQFRRRYGQRLDEAPENLHVLTSDQVLKERKEGRNVLEWVREQADTVGADAIFCDPVSRLFEDDTNKKQVSADFDGFEWDVLQHQRKTGRWRTYVLAMHVNKGEQREAVRAGDKTRQLDVSEVAGVSGFNQWCSTFWTYQEHPTRPGQTVLLHQLDRNTSTDQTAYIFERTNENGATRVTFQGVDTIRNVWPSKVNTTRHDPDDDQRVFELAKLREVEQKARAAGRELTGQALFRAYVNANGIFGATWVRQNQGQQ